jgi:hypothetical protein
MFAFFFRRELVKREQSTFLNSGRIHLDHSNL